jgi:nucleotide-binding universal stress UspA family protein
VVTVLPRIVTVAADAADIVRQHELEPTVHTLIGDPAAEIARIAHDHASDAIHVGRRETGSLAPALESSVSERVIHASGPVTHGRAGRT